MFPFHTWLPDAHVEAPTAGSVILAGVLLKMGTYGFLRFGLPLFPDAAVRLAPVIVRAGRGRDHLRRLGVDRAGRHEEADRLLSVSHLGFVMLGLFTFTPQGLVGGILQMVNHGLSTGALFLLIGMIYERRHTRLIADFGGLWAVVPVFSVILLVVTLSSIGLPGLNGFVGEFLILLGRFQWSRPRGGARHHRDRLRRRLHALDVPARDLRRGAHEETRRLPDLTAREIWTLVPLLILIVWIGVYPKPFTAVTETAVAELLQVVRDKQVAPKAMAWRRASADDTAVTAGPPDARLAGALSAPHRDRGLLRLSAPGRDAAGRADRACSPRPASSGWPAPSWCRSSCGAARPELPGHAGRSTASRSSSTWSSGPRPCWSCSSRSDYLPRARAWSPASTTRCSCSRRSA